VGLSGAIAAIGNVSIVNIAPQKSEKKLASAGGADVNVKHIAVVKATSFFLSMIVLSFLLFKFFK
jgi:hypothetical protein